METSRERGFLAWLDKRLSVREFWQRHMSRYYAAKNLNFWYLFGVFSLVVLVIQIVTGIFLTMYYTPTEAQAFASVEHIMRHVRFGWLIRYMHVVGASAFLVVIYLHIYRAVMYGSYRAPRELIWILGCLLYLIIILEAASGYVLPWGQMSYWAIKVLISLFSVIPWIGDQVVLLFQGDYNVSGATLHRFFSFHVILLPLLMIFLVVLHIAALHTVGSNNPEGVEIKQRFDAKGKPLDGIAFHPYYVVKDLFAVVFFLIVFFLFVFYWPTAGGVFMEHDNFIQANPLVTPDHIAPPWYFAPFFSMLRSVPSKLLGVCLTGASIALLFVMPWLDRSRVKSIRYKGSYSKIALVGFVISFVFLGYLGLQPLSTSNVYLVRMLMGVYFAFFILMPIYTRYEEVQDPPERVD